MNLKEAAKYTGTVLLMKDAREAYANETGKTPPIILSRKVIGFFIVILTIGLKFGYGIELSPETTDEITKQLESLATACISLYGITMVIISFFKKKKGTNEKT